MDFSLFYFADEGSNDRYRLLLEGARFADTRDFAAVWTPERHFHSFGGLYPNPAVTGAAVAAVTERVGIRAGSVVAPLHHPLRIAEEWSVVDNLSGGRVGISLASGWHAVDFALRPENYGGRKEILADTIDQLRRLWRREHLKVVDGDGNDTQVQTFPAPVNPRLPLWLTASGNPAAFRAAGELGVGVLTHLLGQSLDDLAAKIAAYRAAHTDGPGHVVLMLHTFLGTDVDTVRETVREPFSNYLRSSIGLLAQAAGDVLPDLDPDDLAPEDVDFLVERAFERYFSTGGLFGTVETGLKMLEQVHAIGVDEVACLIDFVSDTDAVLGGLDHLDALRLAWQAR
ncbi:LLM class flavin-dependent oxidoreductase [Streptomyces europaeiscabiei]|uniref:MupA/Atu3671 family FMN-dependent luciferase-like monooxygenase n=1 Tax=Streptomyces europaeiscabiei TaxID=146819 RepID=UPI002E18BF8C